MQQTIEQLKDLRLNGLLEAWQEQQAQPTYHDLTFDERLALLVEREHLRRQQQRLQRRLKQAQLFTSATLDAVDFTVPRGLPKTQLLEWDARQVVDSASQPHLHGTHRCWQDLLSLRLGRPSLQTRLYRSLFQNR